MVDNVISMLNSGGALSLIKKLFFIAHMIGTLTEGMSYMHDFMTVVHVYSLLNR